MPKKLNPLQETWWLASSTAIAAGAAYVTINAIDAADIIRLPSGLINASPWTGAALALWSWYRYKVEQIHPRKRELAFSTGFRNSGPIIKQNNTIFSSIVRWSTGGTPSPNDLDRPPGRTIKYKEPRRQEFFWDVNLPDRSLAVRIYESRLLDMTLAAHRRQRCGDAPFSRLYFTRQHPRRFRVPQYYACMAILIFSDLIDGRGQGVSGEMLYPPHATVELAKEWFSPPFG